MTPEQEQMEMNDLLTYIADMGQRLKDVHDMSTVLENVMAGFIVFSSRTGYEHDVLALVLNNIEEQFEYIMRTVNKDGSLK